MYKSFSMELAGRTLTVDIGRVAKTGKWCGIYALRRYYRIINRYCIRKAS